MTAEPDAAQPPEARSGSADDTRLSRPLIRYAIGNAMATLGEWGALIGLLVHVFERSGPNAVGIASFTAILPYVFAAPFTARLAERFRPATVRVVGMLGQALGFGIAATAIALDWPIWTAVLGTAIGYVAATSLRPAAAVLLPAVVRSSRELTTVNVWVGNGDTSALLLGPLMATVLLAVQGPAASLAGCAVMSLGAAALTASFVRNGPPPAGYEDSHDDDTWPGQHRALLHAITGPFGDVPGVFKKPGARAVLLVAAAQFILVGASDVIWVVLAGEHLDLGDAGAGVLSALYGAGSLLCVTVSGRAARRSRLAPMMIGCLVLIALGCLVLGAAIALVTVTLRSRRHRRRHRLRRSVHRLLRRPAPEWPPADLTPTASSLSQVDHRPHADGFTGQSSSAARLTVTYDASRCRDADGQEARWSRTTFSGPRVTVARAARG